MAIKNETFDLFDRIKALGATVHERPWGVVVARSDMPKGNDLMLNIREDGDVDIWYQVGLDDTPTTVGRPADEVGGNLAGLVEGMYKDMVIEAAEGEDFDKEDLIEFMVSRGWRRNDEGKVVHYESTVTFDTWWEAAKACIGVASEC